MTPLQFWEHLPRLKYSVVMPRAVRSEHRFHDHSHAFFELALVLEGRCSWRVGRRHTHHLETGDSLLIAPEVFHHERIPEGASARIAWVGFDFSSEPRLPPPLLAPVRGGAHTQELKHLLQLIFSEHQSTALGSAERAFLALRETLIVFCRALESPATEGTSVEPTRMSARQAQVARSAARYLNDHVAKPLSMREVARYHSLSTPHFSSLFSRYHGVSPQRFLHQARIRHAKELITSGHLTIKEIAAVCGYVDAAHFCRRFKETTGVTPKQYRVTQPAESL